MTKPTYTWGAVASATWYYLWVNGPSGNVIARWYPSDAVCAGPACAVTPETELALGKHTGWVRTWNPAGYGPWSSGLDFTIVPR